MSIVAAGRWHSLGVRSDGSLWMWGYNFYGELGLGHTMDTNRPMPVAPYPLCRQCSGDPATLGNLVFPTGNACQCQADTSITVGSGVTVPNEAAVDFQSPRVNVRSGARFNSGAVVGIRR